MNTKLIIVILVSLLSFSIEARPKKKNAKPVAESFEPLNYTQDPFTAVRTSMDYGYIYSDYASDGISGPLPFWVFRGSLSDHEFRETLIFITDNLSEAYN